MYKDEAGFYHCSDCDFRTKYSGTCQRHIESKHISSSGYSCQFCQTVCPTKNALTMHVGRKHKY